MKKQIISFITVVVMMLTVVAAPILVMAGTFNVNDDDIRVGSNWWVHLFR